MNRNGSSRANQRVEPKIKREADRKADLGERVNPQKAAPNGGSKAQ